MSARIPRVATGLDSWVADGFAVLRGLRVGAIANPTSVDRRIRHVADHLRGAPGVALAALFGPEHGIRADAQDMVGVASGLDARTGVPVHTLYGPTPASLTPETEQLDDLDALVFDVQDVGSRYYTFAATMLYAMRAAAPLGLRFFVLDRPNPIGGLAIEGPTIRPGFESFVGAHPVPIRHGMTVGELARLFNTERSIGADLSVIPCEGWRRADTFDRTGLEWVNPSPNMRSLTEALLYPGVGLLEASNLATGRGTDTPFERLGAPWIDDRAFAKALNELALPGVRFVPVRFTPRERQYAGQECKGVQIAITDWATFEPVDLGIALAITLRSLHPQKWEPAGFLKMLADRDAYEALQAGGDLAAIRATWNGELAEFAKVRGRYLIYK